MTKEAFTDGVWVETYTGPMKWEPIQEEGAELLVQIGQGKFAKYIYEDGHYNLVGTVDWNNKAE